MLSLSIAIVLAAFFIANSIPSSKKPKPEWQVLWTNPDVPKHNWSNLFRKPVDYNWLSMIKYPIMIVRIDNDVYVYYVDSNIKYSN